MKIKYVGHSCFLLEARHAALRILIDPYRAGAYDGALGYRPVKETTDLVLLTHDHPDHSGVEGLPGLPLTVRGSCTARGVAFEALDLPHDSEGGRLRGRVRAFLFEVDGIRIAHLSDLGARLTTQQAQALKGTQVLFVPVGGYYTIDADTAWGICLSLQPNLVIPMHFKTSRVGMPLESVDRFLRFQSKARSIPQTTLEIEKETLPDPVTTVVLTPSN